MDPFHNSYLGEQGFGMSDALQYSLPPSESESSDDQDHQEQEEAPTVPIPTSSRPPTPTGGYPMGDDDGSPPIPAPLLNLGGTRPLGVRFLPFGVPVMAGHIPELHPLATKTTEKKLDAFGNYVQDFPVPAEVSKYNTTSATNDQYESKFMRYSAVTCEPDDFVQSGFRLRQTKLKRKTELMIAITMYNEDEELFCRTMNGVVKNIAELHKRQGGKWGVDSWKKVVVCIISDGRKKIDPGTLAAIAKVGVYQEHTAVPELNSKPVVAHLYEYTSRVAFPSVLPSVMADEPEKTIPPIQIIFCLKERNQKKINSHRWFFNAFGAALKPHICILLDVGTMPGPTSLFSLWNAFDINEHVGGACGEIVASKGKYGEDLINPLVAAQNFEYKMSNILDKPVESVLGYITVLPGAFSAYRYKALLNDDRGEGPLQKYFLGDLNADALPDVFTANMYLAEDRVSLYYFSLLNPTPIIPPD
ncbi:hypothetical protein H0H81_011433 [Sphagnurus paluster]|uniref:Chitin synthase n=1 Tax=Sphagnurus paluster TaxID=117069 RepID=A0A9P7KIC4_9AGAR|nr:hypothetical protein H0H81_011433 [Sphagnurus paluster]